MQRSFGIIFAAFFLAVIQIGGDVALVSADVPISGVHVFQGLLLVFYLATYTFVNYRLRIHRPGKLQSARVNS